MARGIGIRGETVVVAGPVRIVEAPEREAAAGTVEILDAVRLFEIDSLEETIVVRVTARLEGPADRGLVDVPDEEAAPRHDAVGFRPEVGRRRDEEIELRAAERVLVLGYAVAVEVDEVEPAVEIRVVHPVLDEEILRWIDDDLDEPRIVRRGGAHVREPKIGVARDDERRRPSHEIPVERRRKRRDEPERVVDAVPHEIEIAASLRIGKIPRSRVEERHHAEPQPDLVRADAERPEGVAVLRTLLGPDHEVVEEERVSGSAVVRGNPGSAERVREGLRHLLRIDEPRVDLRARIVVEIGLPSGAGVDDGDGVVPAEIHGVVALEHDLDENLRHPLLPELAVAVVRLAPVERDDAAHELETKVEGAERGAVEILGEMPQLVRVIERIELGLEAPVRERNAEHAHAERIDARGAFPEKPPYRGALIRSEGLSARRRRLRSAGGSGSGAGGAAREEQRAEERRREPCSFHRAIILRGRESIRKGYK